MQLIYVKIRINMNDIKLKQKSASKPVISNKFPVAFSQAAAEKREPKSPLKTEKKQTIKLSKVLKHLDKMPSQSTEKLFEPYPKLSNTITKLPYLPVHLEEMITLSQTPSISCASTVKKAVHAGSLTLYSIKQIPISTREQRNLLRVWIEKWQSYKAPVFLKVLETFWNIPEGCVSIVCEYMSAGSLGDLCKNIGTIPEKPLSEIARVLLRAAVALTENGEHFEGLSSNHVLFTRHGEIRISPGISKRINQEETETDAFSIGKTLIKAIFNEVPEVIQRNCCLLHSIERNPITDRVSAPLQEFLCALTSYRGSATASQLLTHAWLALEEYSGPDVELREIINIGFRGDEYWGAGDIQLNRLCEALKVVMVGKKFLRPSIQAIEALAEEIAVPKHIFVERIINVYDELSN